MARYDAKQVCLNGHHITDRAKTGSQAKEHCDKCGAETITECPECNGMMKGKDLDSNVVAVGFEPSIASHCEHCGEPFPWTGDDDDDTDQQNVTWNLEAEEAIDRICNRFSNVVYHLNDRYNGRDTIGIQDEYDVQDVLNALLRIHFNDVRPEEGTPSHAGSSSRIDFLLKDEKIGIEVKKREMGWMKENLAPNSPQTKNATKRILIATDSSALSMTLSVSCGILMYSATWTPRMKISALRLSYHRRDSWLARKLS